MTNPLNPPYHEREPKGCNDNYSLPPRTPPRQTTTPQELYRQIENSRDKLFFIAHTAEGQPGDSKKKKRWRLVRVGLDISRVLAEDTARGCESTGKYCVEFYAKASCDDQNNGTSLKDDEKMKPDNQSRYWLEWHDYRLDNKSGEMVRGNWKEFPPNTASAIHRRLVMGASDASAIDDDGEVERHNLRDKYSIWADIVDLMDVETRLVGPFDFDDDIEIPPPLTEDLVPLFDEEKKKLFMVNYKNLIVKDRVPWSQWQELMEALRGRDDIIDPPTVVAEFTSKEIMINSKPRASGEKRARTEEAAALLFQDPHSTNPSCLVCHECRTNDEGKGGLLTFPTTTSAQASLHVHLSCASKSNMIVSRETLESTLAQTRHAHDGHGNVYYVTNELHDALGGAGDKWAGDLKLTSSSSRVKTPLSVKPTKRSTRVQPRVTQPTTQPRNLQAAKSQMTSTTCKPLQGLSAADFTKDEIDSLTGPDGVSEENATLNHKAKQRQLRRSSVPLLKESNSIFRHGISYTDELLSQRSPEPAEDLPEGWIIIKKKRLCTGSKVYDKFWYSPKKRYMLRSRPDVLRFLEALKESDGDETKAIETIGNGKKRK